MAEHTALDPVTLIHKVLGTHGICSIAVSYLVGLAPGDSLEVLHTGALERAVATEVTFEGVRVDLDHQYQPARHGLGLGPNRGWWFSFTEYQRWQSRTGAFILVHPTQIAQPWLLQDVSGVQLV
jgi:hypothetical protein